MLGLLVQNWALQSQPTLLRSKLTSPGQSIVFRDRRRRRHAWTVMADLMSPGIEFQSFDVGVEKA